MTKTLHMVLSSWFFKVFFLGSVRNRWAFWAGHGAHDRALGKACEWKTCHSLSAFLLIAYTEQFIKLQKVDLIWSQPAGGNSTENGQFTGAIKTKVAHFPQGARRWEKAMKWQTVKGTKDWLSITKLGSLQSPLGQGTEISRSNLILPRRVHSGPFPWSFFIFLILKSFGSSWLG